MILAGSPDIDGLHFSDIGRFQDMTKVAVKDDTKCRRKICIKSLHFAGRADKIVPIKESERLASRFESSEFHEHDQGHCIPTKSHCIATMVLFFESILMLTPSATNTVIIKSPCSEKLSDREREIEGNESQIYDNTRKNGGSNVSRAKYNDINNTINSSSKSNNTISSNNNNNNNDNNNNNNNTVSNSSNSSSSSSNSSNDKDNNNDNHNKCGDVKNIKCNDEDNTNRNNLKIKKGSSSNMSHKNQSNNHKNGTDIIDKKNDSTKSNLSKKSLSSFLPPERQLKEGVKKESEKTVERPSNCTSESNASEQRDEIEALTAIYSESEIKLVRSPPESINMPSACISITLTAPIQTHNPEIYHTTDTAVSQIQPHRWQGELRLLIDFPPNYPEDSEADPRIDVEVGSLSMMEFPSGFRKALQNNVVRNRKAL